MRPRVESWRPQSHYINPKPDSDDTEEVLLLTVTQFTLWHHIKICCSKCISFKDRKLLECWNSWQTLNLNISVSSSSGPPFSWYGIFLEAGVPHVILNTLHLSWLCLLIFKWCLLKTKDIRNLSAQHLVVSLCLIISYIEPNQKPKTETAMKSKNQEHYRKIKVNSRKVKEEESVMLNIKLKSPYYQGDVKPCFTCLFPSSLEYTGWDCRFSVELLPRDR